MNEKRAEDHDRTEDDLILDFVNGLLPDAQRRAVLARAASDPDFEERLRALSASFERARAQRAWEGTVARTGARAPGPASGPRAPGPRRRRWAAAAAMAAILATFAALEWIARAPDDEGVPAYWIPVDTSLRQTRSGPQGEASFDAALQAYEDRDPARAAALLGALELPEGMDDLRRIYLASALLQGGDAARARDMVTSLDLPTVPQPWRDRAAWVLYLSLRQLKDGAAADPLLVDLAAGSGEIGALARQEQSRLGR